MFFRTRITQIARIQVHLHVFVLFVIFVFVFLAIIVSVQLFASFVIFVFATNPLAYHSLLILCSKMPVCIQAERQDHEVAHTLTREIRRIGGALQGESQDSH